jgi:hypothetical protein
MECYKLEERKHAIKSRIDLENKDKLANMPTEGEETATTSAFRPG